MSVGKFFGDDLTTNAETATPARQDGNALREVLGEFLSTTNGPQPLGDLENSCRAHQAFRCNECFPSRFTTPVFKFTHLDPALDPKPRWAIVMQDDAGNSIYIPSDSVPRLAGILRMVSPGWHAK